MEKEYAMEAKDKWTNGELMEVARRQKYIILMVIILFLLNVLVSSIHLRIPFAGIVLLIVQGYYVYSLAKSLKYSRIGMWLILGLFPLIGLFVLLRINANATKILQTNGIKVGLMGAKSSDLEKLKTSN